MARTSTLLLALCTAGLLSGCDPHKLRVTDRNRDGLVDSLRDNSKLSHEEKSLLGAYMARAKAEAPGKTVAELIEAQRAFDREEQAKQEAARRVSAQHEKVARDRWQMQAAFGWSVTDKRLLAKDAKAQRPEDLIVVDCQYDNRSGKAIAAFQGKLRFRDAYGEELFQADVKADQALPAGGHATFTAQKPFDANKDAKLRDLTPKSVIVDFVPRSVTLADGTVLGEK
jgi:hypothetical protein